MELTVLNEELTVCKLDPKGDFDLDCRIFFLARTADELSLVCPTEETPAFTSAREDGWRGFRVSGSMDFGLIGILAKIADILAEQKISIFAVSTYDTDYILVKQENLEKALKALADHGYAIRYSS